jgi:hypothetical protein
VQAVSSSDAVILVQTPGTSASTAGGSAATIFTLDCSIGDTVVVLLYDISGTTTSVSSPIGTFVAQNSEGNQQLWVCQYATAAGNTFTASGATTYAVAGYDLQNAGTFSLGGTGVSYASGTSASPSGGSGTGLAVTGGAVLVIMNCTDTITADPSSPWTVATGGEFTNADKLSTVYQTGLGTSFSAATWTQSASASWTSSTVTILPPTKLGKSFIKLQAVRRADRY